mmetsp:Transcript_49325/g.119630  ORF Transcript_49325/g.119630 Transcript_49325/m.119630 type:complete len:97 (-) Transcript_49325:381-671(-)
MGALQSSKSKKRVGRKESQKSHTKKKRNDLLHAERKVFNITIDRLETALHFLGLLEEWSLSNSNLLIHLLNFDGHRLIVAFELPVMRRGLDGLSSC